VPRPPLAEVFAASPLVEAPVFSSPPPPPPEPKRRTYRPHAGAGTVPAVTRREPAPPGDGFDSVSPRSHPHTVASRPEPTRGPYVVTSPYANVYFLHAVQACPDGPEPLLGDGRLPSVWAMSGDVQHRLSNPEGRTATPAPPPIIREFSAWIALYHEGKIACVDCEDCVNGGPGDSSAIVDRSHDLPIRRYSNPNERLDRGFSINCRRDQGYPGVARLWCLH
jgi:hypothetical protein